MYRKNRVYDLDFQQQGFLDYQVSPESNAQIVPTKLSFDGELTGASQPSLNTSDGQSGFVN